MRGRTTISTTLRSNESLPRVMIVDYHQDDPKKCTSARLEKFNLAIPLHGLQQISRSTIVLNPISNLTISYQDRPSIGQYGLVGLDCSWNQSDSIFQSRIKGENRRLPTLLAGNPTNYGARGKLSTVEALAAALIITGFRERAQQLLKIFRWGETFLTLNHDPLKEYSKTSPKDMFLRETEFFPIAQA